MIGPIVVKTLPATVPIGMLVITCPSIPVTSAKRSVVSINLTSEPPSPQLAPPSISELERRLRDRGQDSDEVIRARMAKSQDEISHWAEYDYVVVNDNVETSLVQLIAILQAERQKRDRQPGLSDFVRALNKEFNSL